MIKSDIKQIISCLRAQVNKFINLIVVMVSQVYTYVKTYQIISC